jgi:hypothetical protein
MSKFNVARRCFALCVISFVACGAVAIGSPEEQATAQAQVLIERMKAFNASAVVASMPSKFLTRMRWDREAARRDLTALYDRLKARGVSFEISLGSPTKAFRADDGLFTFVPYAIISPDPKGRRRQLSFFIALSEDNGTTWKFLDGHTIDSRKKMSDLIPGFPGVDIPPIGEEILH